MATGQFSCSACGKTYAWKAQLAGKRVKCKCGNPISVPAEDPAAADALPPEFEDLYALAQGEAADEPIAPPPIARAAVAPALAGAGAGPDLAPVAPGGRGARKTAVRPGGGGGGAVSTASGRPSMLGYAQMGGGRRRLADDDKNRSGDVFFNPVKDVYIPAGLILLGTLLLFYIMMQDRGLDAGTALVAVGILSVVNLLLVVPGILLTVRLFDLGIGPIGPAIIKLAACALAPGAIADFLKMYMTGTFGGFLAWFISLIVTFTIFMKLLDMDLMETLACSCIIWVIRTWLVYLLLAAVLSGSLGGAFATGLGAMGSAGAGKVALSGEVDPDDDEAFDAMHAREHNEMAIGILTGKGGVEGKQWIEGAPNRVLGKQSRDKSLEIIRGFYQAGVMEVRVSPAGVDDKGQEVVNTMVVCPPEDNKAARDRCIEQLKKLAKHLKRFPFRDRGEKYFIVRMTRGDEDITLSAPPPAPGAASPAGTGAKSADPDGDEE